MNIKHILPALLTIGLLTSCEKDLLDTVPNDRISSDIFWKTEKDATLASNGLYPSLDGVNIFAIDGVTDIAHVNQVFQVESNIEKGIHDALNSRPQTEWTSAYRGIRLANDFLGNIGTVQTANTAFIARLKGEARTLRAYQYIKLVAMFGDVPLVTTSIGIDEGRALKRAPSAQIWDFVLKELTEAANDLPAVQAEKGRVTKGAALALKARAALYAGRYQEAADAAKAVIDSKTYSIYSSYTNLFSYAAENNSEVILDKQFIKDTYSNNVFANMGPYSQRTANNTYVPTKALVDAYPMANGKEITDPTSGFDPKNPYANRDPRLRASIFVTGDDLPDGKKFDSRPTSGTADAVGNTYLATSTGFVLKKYINKEDLATGGNCGINLILLRYAEVLLTYAEAKIELNQIDASVYDAINQIRQRADVKLPALEIGLTQAQLREAVRKERTLELAFEGLRLYDIRRWKIAEKVMVGDVYGMTYVDGTQLKTIQIASFTRVFDPAKHYLWAIPQKERELNPELTQNTGW
ncbi:RagB/SusD family nutrient uptake outer membrane protein [Runella aurantiaca]|uniref:RagB/SusD family nutrient uptake outer membrane protein n=1 Tax=Runella aurantiaca TaxID=2282308 RepID=A0A369IHF4_9BACT|nr:RagB/SusD family nutrient uptake outer membrane protein [Runella aurantiaca]RDB06066.1 RagB/SusD family nutrient uptake outer membrane protein [Runella aurantiaca]